MADGEMTLKYPSLDRKGGFFLESDNGDPPCGPAFRWRLSARSWPHSAASEGTSLSPSGPRIAAGQNQRTVVSLAMATVIPMVGEALC